MWAILSQFFVNPAFLAGVLTAAIPVILHLRYRRTAIEVPFPSLKLLRLSTRRVARRKRIEELLLLIVRAALLVCLALALAKPFLKASGLLASRSNTAVAVVLDNSASMAARVGGQRRIDLARARVEEVLSGLGRERTKSGVFLAAGADDQQPGQTLTGNLDDVRTALAKAEPSPRQTALAEAVARALDALAASGEPHCELYLVTDLQAYGLREALEILRSRDFSAHLHVVIVPVAPGAPNDVAVVDLTVSGRGLLAHAPLTLEATLKNLGPAPTEPQAELLLDGSRSSVRSVRVGPGSSASVTFPVRFEDAGLKVAAVQVSGDDNPLDDRRVLALPLEDALRVLVLEGAASTLDFQNAGFYVTRALDPFGAQAPQASSGIRPLKVPEAALLTEDLSRYRAVFVLNPGALSLEAIKRLKNYVRTGGGLVIFPGEATDGPRLTQDLGLSVAVAGQGSDGILPARIGQRFGKVLSSEQQDEQPAARVVDIAFAHPVLAPFRGLDRTIFTAIQAHAGFELAPPAGGSAEVLLMLDGQRPLLSGGPAGAGEAYLFAVCPTPAWTNMPVRSGSVFLPLLHTLCHHLAGRRTQTGSLVVGHAILRPHAAQARRALLVAPDRQERVLESKQGEPLAADLDRIGVWTLVMGAKPEETLSFSVNADPAEADARQLAPGEVREVFQHVAQEVLVAEAPATLTAALHHIREGVPLWNALLIIVLALAVVEIYIANRLRGALRPEGAEAQPAAAASAQGAPAEQEVAVRQ